MTGIWTKKTGALCRDFKSGGPDPLYHSWFRGLLFRLDAHELSGKYSISQIQGKEGADTGNLILKELSVSDLVGGEIERQAEKKLTKDALLSLDTVRIYDQEFAADLRAAFEYRYPHEADTRLHTKMTVSELKKSRGSLQMRKKVSFFLRFPHS